MAYHTVTMGTPLPLTLPLYITIGVAQYNPFAGRKILPGLVHAFGEPGQRQRDYMGGMPCKFHPGGKKASWTASSGNCTPGAVPPH